MKTLPKSMTPMQAAVDMTGPGGVMMQIPYAQDKGLVCGFAVNKELMLQEDSSRQSLGIRALEEISRCVQSHAALMECAEALRDFMSRVEGSRKTGTAYFDHQLFNRSAAALAKLDALGKGNT